jgi:superfamily II DNA or RNA helicase
MPEVRRTADFARVEELARRVVTFDDARAWAAVFTAELRAPGGTRELKPWQGAALAEAVENNGFLGGLPVGFGKTDLSWCLPRALQSRSSVLIVPAALEEKTRADFRALVGQWRCAVAPPRILTTQWLAREQNQDELFQIDPDLIMLDECG